MRYYGLDAIGPAFVIEVQGAEHVPMVCYGKGIHAASLGFCYISGYRSSPIKEREISMVVQMNEVTHHFPQMFVLASSKDAVVSALMFKSLIISFMIPLVLVF